MTNSDEQPAGQKKALTMVFTISDSVREWLKKADNEEEKLRRGKIVIQLMMKHFNDARAKLD